MNPQRRSRKHSKADGPKLFVSIMENSPEGGGAIERGMLKMIMTRDLKVLGIEGHCRLHDIKQSYRI